MKFKKSVFKIISACLIAFLGLYVCIVGIEKARDYQVYKEKEITTKIYSVWHVETFEGGSKSRIQYLKNIARNLEKQNPGVLFMVSSVSPEDLENKLKSTTPNIISFGYGVGKILLPFLCELDNTFNVRDSLIESATYAKKLMAMPYIASGYATFTHGGEIKTWIYGSNGYTSPKFELPASKIDGQYAAYKEFIYNKQTALVGTARDVFRVTNLNSIGRLNASICPIAGYTDLIQYCGILNKDEISLAFLKELINHKSQNSLLNYSLFPVTNVKIYSSGIYKEMEDAIFEAYTPNVFTKSIKS